MSLDIHTEKGQISLIHEREVQELIKFCWNIGIVETPKDSSAKCDGFLVKDNVLKGCFETKCRYDMDYNLFLERGSWLITYDKIMKGKLISKLLQIPYYCFLYLLPKDNPSEKVLLYVKLTNSNGEFIFDIPTEVQRTQKTINGGEIERLNAYIPADKLSFVKPIKVI